MTTGADSFFALASIVAGVMYGQSFPVIALEPRDFARLRTGQRDPRSILHGRYRNDGSVRGDPDPKSRIAASSVSIHSDGQARRVDKLTGIASRFGAFVAERHPFALADAIEAFERRRRAAREPRGRDARSTRCVPRSAASWRGGWPRAGRPAGCPRRRRASRPRARSSRRATKLLDACDGFLRREAIEASLTRDERREILRGMMLTRATDNRLKTFFTSGEVRYGSAAFQGKGFRSLGQEAIYAAGIRLRRGAALPRRDGRWTGDVIAPVIRDLGVDARDASGRPTTVRMVLNAQMGKAGPPMDGKDLHIGDFDWGILPPAAPLTTATLTMAGHGAGVRARRRRPRRGVVHRRRRLVARRMARGDQPVRRAPAAGGLLHREQPDGALDAGRGAVGRPRVRRQGGRLRHSRHHDRRHRSRRDCGGVRVGGRARARRRRARADRARRDAHVRPRASRRHAVPRARIRSRPGTIRR